jgi:small subunit ribosomal protein S3
VGQKVSPIGFRIGVIKDWEAKWYADKNYTEQLHEDLQIRKTIAKQLDNAGVSRVEIERAANRVRISIYTAKPGIVIGKGGAGVEELRKRLEKQTGKQVHINIVEIKNPELDATLVAENIAVQLTKRVAFRRAMKQAVFRTMRAGAKGIKVMISGRLGGAEIARTESYHEGTVPLQTLRADIDYGFVEAHTTYGRIGVKVWIYKGDVLPTRQTKTGGGDRHADTQKS